MSPTIVLTGESKMKVKASVQFQFLSKIKNKKAIQGDVVEIHIRASLY